MAYSKVQVLPGTAKTTHRGEDTSRASKDKDNSNSQPPYPPAGDTQSILQKQHSVLPRACTAPQASAVSHFWRQKALSDPLQPIFCSYLPWNNTVLSLIAQCLSAPSAVPGCCKLTDPARSLGATDSKSPCLQSLPLLSFSVLPMAEIPWYACPQSNLYATTQKEPQARAGLI